MTPERKVALCIRFSRMELSHRLRAYRAARAGRILESEYHRIQADGFLLRQEFVSKRKI